MKSFYGQQEIRHQYIGWDTYAKILKEHDDRGGDMIGHIERFAFYEEAAKAYAVVVTGESALYANIMLQKGVVIR